MTRVINFLKIHGMQVQNRNINHLKIFKAIYKDIYNRYLYFRSSIVLKSQNRISILRHYLDDYQQDDLKNRLKILKTIPLSKSY